MQVQRSVDGKYRQRFENCRLPDVGCNNLDFAVLRLFDRTMSIKIDRRVKNQSSVEIAIRRYVAAAAG